MEEVGKMLREMTEGTVDMLRLRSQAKSSIHAEMTIIGPRAVNPLKAAWDVDVALRHLLAPQRADLMGPVRAVTDAYDDLRAHDRGLAAVPARQSQGAAVGAAARDLRRHRQRRARGFLVGIRTRVPPRVLDGPGRISVEDLSGQGELRRV